MTANQSDLEHQLAVLEADINEYLDENPTTGEVLTVSDIDENIARIEGFRTTFRNIHTQLKTVTK